MESKIGFVTITASTLNIRESADPKSKIVGTVKKGDKLNIVEHTNGMYKIAKGQWISDSAKYSEAAKTVTKPADKPKAEVKPTPKPTPKAETKPKYGPTTTKLIEKYGNPFEKQAEFEKKHMILYTYPDDIRTNIPVLGRALYCNKDLVAPYTKALRALIKAKLHDEISSNDECFCVRKIRGSNDLSVHSWGLAVDLNPQDNPLGMTRAQAVAAGKKPFTEAFQKVFRDVGFICGIDFKRADGMHFQYVSHL